MSPGRDETLRLQDRAPFVAFLLFGLLAVSLTRLPRLLGEGVLIDGDEAIVGLMARHLLHGQEIALFFYGQSYGLSIAESGFGAMSFAMLGESVLSLKIAMLALWSMGWVFFTLALDRSFDRTIALGASLLLIFCPAWGEWSLLARGGYITAFVLTAATLLLCVVTAGSTRPRPLLSGLAGAGAMSIFFAQPIFAVAFAPYLVLMHWRRSERGEILPALGGATATLVVVLLAVGGERADYWSPGILAPAGVVDSLVKLPGRLLVFFGGVYYYDIGMPAGGLTRLGAMAWFALLALACLGFVLRWERIRRSYLAVASIVSIALVIAMSLCVDETAFGFRYLLPVAAPLVLLIACVAQELWWHSRGYRTAMPFVWLALLGTGAGAHVEAHGLSRFGTSAEREAIGRDRAELIDSLLARGIHHVYSLDANLQWNIAFESSERILARWAHPADRYPEYPRAVDAALLGSSPVALVGRQGSVGESQKIFDDPSLGLHRAGTHYFWVEVPGVGFIRRLGFELNRPSQRGP